MLSMVEEIYAGILVTRVTEDLRMNKTVSDQILTLKQIGEKA